MIETIQQRELIQTNISFIKNQNQSENLHDYLLILLKYLDHIFFILYLRRNFI